MSDNELRDKLASEYADKIRSSESGTAQDGFVAGWDAARANPQLIKDSINMLNIITSLSSENNQLHEQLEWSLRNEQQYKDELKASLERENQLRAEVQRLSAENKHLRTNVLNPLIVNDMEENIRLKAQCEKLAEALKKIDNLYLGTVKQPNATAWFRHLGTQAGQVAHEALAEYRKVNKC